MNIPNVFEKTEEGESITCALCGQVILLMPNKYPENIIQQKISIHWLHCPVRNNIGK